MNFLLQALVKKLEGEIEVAKANIKVYERNPVGIGAVSYTHLTLPTILLV